MKEYDIPDEHLSYSELKDRIRVECARVLPKKEFCNCEYRRL
jgi:hypothetical protein